MNEYKINSNDKIPFLLINAEENTGTCDFLFFFQNLNYFWNENDLNNVKIVLEKLVKWLKENDNNLSFSTLIEDDVLISLNIMHYIFEKIDKIKTLKPLKEYSNILNLFLQLALSLFDNSTASQNMLIEEKPIHLLWELASIQISEIYINSLKLIYVIVNTGQAENEINFLLPHIFTEALTNKHRRVRYVMNLLPIVTSYCDNTNQSVLNPYVDDILNVIHQLVETKKKYYYYFHSLIIVRKLQVQHYDIFRQNHDLFILILNMIDDWGLQEFYEKVFRIMNLSMFFISNDEKHKAELISEILPHLDRIITIFQSFEDDENILIDIVDLLSNLIVDEQSIIQKLLDAKCISYIIRYYNNSIFRLRDSISWLVWNMLHGCTTDQLSYILSSEIYAVILDTLDLDDYNFLFLVSKVINLMIEKLAYFSYGTNGYIDNIILKIQNNMESYDFQIRETFHNEIPQFF